MSNSPAESSTPSVASLISLFEAGWSSRRPQIEDVVAEAPLSDRRQLLLELIHVDLELRLKAGEDARVEDYLARFSELAGSAVVALIRAEYAYCAKLRGHTVKWEDYLNRFPAYREALQAAELASNAMQPVLSENPIVPLLDATPPSSDGAETHSHKLLAADTESAELRQLLAPPRDSNEIGRLGGFRVLKVLGKGGMGIVFLAEDVKLKRQVALKTMKRELAVNPAHKERFFREARAAAALEHDHIVPIYQIGEENGTPFLAMPILEGRGG